MNALLKIHSLYLLDGEQIYQPLNVNSTLYEGLSAENKTFYDMTLIDEAEPNLVHDQFAQKRPIPRNGGKKIEFRKYLPYKKALTPLVEGVTPIGNKLQVTTLEAELSQYGDYTILTDVLDLTAIDNNILETTKIHGNQAGRTLDTITRNAMQSGGNVSYASKWNGSTATAVTQRKDLDNTSILKVLDIKKAATKLKLANAPSFSGYYIAIVNPAVSFDIMSDPEWVDAHKYAEPENLYTGEIGRIAGVRFIESTEAKVFRGIGLTKGSRTLTVKTAVSTASTTIPVKEVITDDDVTAFAARSAADKQVYLGGTKVTVAALVAGAANSASITLAEASTASANAVIAPYGGTSGDLAVFGTLIFGRDAYGVTEVNGGGLQTIVKQKGSGGTTDPLDQRSSVGWKAMKTAEILVQDYLVRLESVSPTYSEDIEAN